MRPAHLMAFGQKSATEVGDELTFSVMACQCAGCVAHLPVKSADSISAAVNSFHAAFAASNQVPSEIAAAPTNTIVDTIEVDGDTDSFVFNLVAGQTYTFSVRGTGGSGGLNDPLISLFGTTGSLIVTDDDGGTGTNSLINFTATTTGAYTLVVGSFDNGADDTGQYQIDLVEKPAADEVPDTFAGAVALDGNDLYFGFIDSPAQGPVYSGLTEVDTFKIEVEAGKIYTIEMAGGATDYFSQTTSELDTVLIVYDSEGNEVASNDDVSFPGDISSRLSFFAETSGTYYIDATAYTGASGGYTLVTTEVDPSTLNPLDAINWFSADNIDTVNNTATVYFAASGETFGEPGPSYGWNATEKAAIFNALAEYTKILGINYVETTDSSTAEFRLITTTSTTFGAYFYPQDPGFGTQEGIGGFNVNSGGWDKLGFSTQDIPGDQLSLLQGGFSFGTILHEFGHAHGLAHPHDNGGGSDIMPGVTASTGSYGVYNLNQGVYTVMSYNDAWDFHPDGPSPFTIAGVSNGWSGTLSAFDIALLQMRYGVQNAYATGDSVYELKDAQAIGTYYETIWDTGGTDTIRYSGNRSTTIDLLAATLTYTPTGGGVLSFVDDIKGGYTIANGVVIENAQGGGGADVLRGNAVANLLLGNGGNDWLMGKEGADTLNGGAGTDIASYREAASGVAASLATNKGTAGEAAGDKFTSIESLEGSNFADTLEGGNGADTLTGRDGNDLLVGGNGNDSLDGGAGSDTLEGGNGADILSGGDGDDVLTGGNDADTLTGGAGDDALNGGNGDDFLDAGAGNDALSGGNGNDTFNFADLGGFDVVNDFRRGADKIDVSDLGDFAWVGSGAFSGGNDGAELRGYTLSGKFYLSGDANGDGSSDFLIQVNTTLTTADIILTA